MVKQKAQIECVVIVEHESAYERITRIGGYGSKQWTISLANAIYFIEKDLWEFYVEGPNGKPNWLVVATSPEGINYLKTRADGDEPATLLNLPQCI